MPRSETFLDNERCTNWWQDCGPEQERVILAVAGSKMEREEFTEWVKAHVEPREETKVGW